MGVSSYQSVPLIFKLAEGYHYNKRHIHASKLGYSLKNYLENLDMYILLVSRVSSNRNPVPKKQQKPQS